MFEIALKLAPVIVTKVPADPVVGVKLEIEGGGVASSFLQDCINITITKRFRRKMKFNRLMLGILIILKLKNCKIDKKQSASKVT